MPRRPLHDARPARRRWGVGAAGLLLVSAAAWAWLHAHAALAAPPDPASAARTGTRLPVVRAPAGDEEPPPGSAPAPLLPGAGPARPEALARDADGPLGEPATWRGRVVSSGTPVAGARVWVVPNGRGLQARGLPGEPYLANETMGGELSQRLDAPLGLFPSATTDGSGEFALAGHHLHDPSPENEVSLGRPYATVVVAAPGFAVLTSRSPSPARGVVDLGELCLSPELVVVGRVLDAQGRPLAGAEVTPWYALPYALLCDPREQDLLAALVPELHTTRTGADGRFALGGLHVGDLTFVAHAPGHVRALVQAPLALPPAPGQPFDAGDVVLAPGGRLAGRVTDAEGRPVHGIEVLATAHELDGLRRGCIVDGFREGDDTLPLQLLAASEPLAVTARTGPDGRFVLHGLPDAPVTLYAHGRGWEPARWRAARPGGDDVHIVVAREETLRLRVVAAESDEPLPGAAVHAWRITGVEASDVPLPVSRAGPGEVLVHRVGPLGTRVSASAGGRAAVAEQIGPPADGEAHTLRLPAGKVVRGRVSDSTGAPLHGVRVTAERSRLLLTAPADITDRDGRFELRDLPEQRLVFVASHPAFVDEAFDLWTGDGEPQDIVLRRACRLSARVTDSSGSPVARRVVAVKGPVRADGQPGVLFRATSEEGRVAHDGLRPGHYEVSVRGGGSLTLELPEGDAREVALVAAPDGRICGRVLRGGLPVAGATVAFESSGSRASTDGDGRFEIAVAEPAAGRLAVTHGDARIVDDARLSVGWGERHERDVHLP